MTRSSPSAAARQPTYLDLIRRGAALHGERDAVVCGDERLSFRQVDQLSSQLAHALLGQGVRQGQRVALLLNNGLYSVPTDFACVKAGINRVPLNARLALAEHAHMLRNTGCEVLVFGPDLQQRASELNLDLGQGRVAVEGACEVGGVPVDLAWQYYMSRPQAIFAGTNEIQRNLLARAVLGMPS